MKRAARNIACAAFCFFSLIHGDQTDRNPLFKIERSKNANIIQYDARTGPDGRLHAKEPVVAYWIRLAEQGQVKKLSWIQWKFAFGFDADYNPEKDSVSLDMALPLGRLITVEREGDVYRASTMISGMPAWLDRIYIDATRKGLVPEIAYIELFGKDRSTGDECYERFVP